MSGESAAAAGAGAAAECASLVLLGCLGVGEGERGLGEPEDPDLRRCGEIERMERAVLVWLGLPALMRESLDLCVQ
jgi:hypothetical protein